MSKKERNRGEAPRLVMPVVVWTNDPGSLADHLIELLRRLDVHPSERSVAGARRYLMVERDLNRAAVDQLSAQQVLIALRGICVQRGLLPDKTATPAANSPEDWRPVAKPDGWTRSELVSQAKDAAGSFSASTFDTIRKAARVKPSERGGKGQQRRFSLAEVRQLIAATEAGNFRNKADIADSWRQLRAQ